MEENSALIIQINKPIEFIRNFFNNQKASDDFLLLVKTLQALEPKLILRADNSIIGMSMPDERYWFYIVHDGDSGFALKFKHAKRLPFPIHSGVQYFQLCTQCVDYYKGHAGEFAIGVPYSKQVEETPVATKELVMPRDEFVISCQNCRLHISEECTSLSNRPCEDYRTYIPPTEEERANWPTGGDATATRENYRIRRNENRST